jgi:hypothetical protein
VQTTEFAANQVPIVITEYHRILPPPQESVLRITLSSGFAVWIGVDSSERLVEFDRQPGPSSDVPILWVIGRFSTHSVYVPFVSDEYAIRVRGVVSEWRNFVNLHVCEKLELTDVKSAFLRMVNRFWSISSSLDSFTIDAIQSILDHDTGLFARILQAITVETRLTGRTRCKAVQEVAQTFLQTTDVFPPPPDWWGLGSSDESSALELGWSEMLLLGKLHALWNFQREDGAHICDRLIEKPTAPSCGESELLDESESDLRDEPARDESNAPVTVVQGRFSLHNVSWDLDSGVPDILQSALADLSVSGERCYLSRGAVEVVSGAVEATELSAISLA